ncbi:MAG TPA: peptidoglycan-binding protein [Clostridiaceae bacterium]
MKNKVKTNIFLGLSMFIFVIIISVSCLFLTGNLSIFGFNINHNKVIENSSTKKNTIEASKVDNNIEKATISIKAGDSGDKVTEVQKKLYNIGMDVSVDGSYGPMTSSKVSSFQKSYSLAATGIIDNETYTKLMGMKDIRTYGKSIPDILTSADGSNQVIVVTAADYGTYHISLKAYEKKSDTWELFDSVTGVIGKNGFSDNRKEGDLSTPTGKYSFAFLFGWADNPGFKLDFKKSEVGDYWVSNKTLSEYNVWIHYTGNPDSRFLDYEALWKQPLFKYAAVINFNYGADKVLTKGSGIFLHIAPKNGGFTLGCVGIEESHLIKLLKWMDPAKNPVIIMGVKGHI